MRGQQAKSGHKLNTAAKKHRELYKLHGNYIKNKLKSNGVKAALRLAAPSSPSLQRRTPFIGGSTMKNSFRRLWDSYFRDKSRDEHDPWSHYGPKLARLREYLPRDGLQTVALSGSLIMFRPSRQ